MSSDLVALSTHLGLVDELYARYLEDPASVDPGFRALFEDGAAESPAGNGRGTDTRISTQLGGASVATAPGQLSAWPLVNAYRVRGHILANIDPLGLMVRPSTSELDPATYGFTDADLDREFPGAGGLHGGGGSTLREILARVKATYCAGIGLEFMHIAVPAKKKWLAERMETLVERGAGDRSLRRRMLQLVIAAEMLERFCHIKFPGTKRFSLEGSEGVIPILDLVLTHGARLGAIEAVLGMAHRGRLNVLIQIMKRMARDVFAEFEDIEPEASLGGGDVKYHLGYSCDRTDAYGNTMHVSLAFNPSHLEAVDPVVVGRVRAKQARHNDWEHRSVLGVLVHGDAAFAGQGLVPETFNLANLHGYRTGGTVHIIVNNQIGFTASPEESRSTPYCTDVAKMIQCPIWHVNGDDLDAVASVVEMALEYRSQFKSDVVIDMLCYRKFGHNEMDEPGFTNPVMYQRIKDKPSIVDEYAKRLVSDGVVSETDLQSMIDRERLILEGELEVARATIKRPRPSAFGGIWSNYKGGPDLDAPDAKTGVSLEILQAVTASLTTLPDGMRPHPKIKRLLAQRAEMGRGERPIDWGMAELLAYGSLLWEGTPVRLSGQDSSRGTFSHRHAIVTDINQGTEYMLLGHLHAEQGDCRIFDSPLSEAGVLGFEFGYSLDYPDALVIWEAQFGDFANGAQVIIDQFIVASEDKWNRICGLTLLLPHGYEGQGPEHSSARIERFLQACAEDNIQVVQPTTPAQMFHMLRRQVVRRWRKPLIVMTPKSLLRHPRAISTLEELVDGEFHRILADDRPRPADGVDRVVFCSGKIYFELDEERDARGDNRTAILRIEQLYPWRNDEIERAVSAYPNAKEFWYVQDEPGNMGALQFVLPRLAAIFGWERVRSAARAESASPATGSHKAHALEHKILMEEVFGEGR